MQACKKNSWNQQTQKDNTFLKAIVFIWTIFRVFHFSSCKKRIDLNTEFEHFFHVLDSPEMLKTWNIEYVKCLAQFFEAWKICFKKGVFYWCKNQLHINSDLHFTQVFGRFCNEELLGSTSLENSIRKKSRLNILLFQSENCSIIHIILCIFIGMGQDLTTINYVFTKNFTFKRLSRGYPMIKDLSFLVWNTIYFLWEDFQQFSS